MSAPETPPPSDAATPPPSDAAAQGNSPQSDKYYDGETDIVIYGEVSKEKPNPQYSRGASTT
jgi:hypothetical protein